MRVLIDGRNRIKACELLGLVPRTEPLGARSKLIFSETRNTVDFLGGGAPCSG